MDENLTSQAAMGKCYAVRQETPNITPLIHRPVSIATDRPNATPPLPPPATRAAQSPAIRARGS